MRVVDITEDTREGWRTVEATVVWETRRHEPQQIHYSAPESHEHMVSTTPDMFLCSSAMAAAYEQETRIVVDDPVCPKLVEGVSQAFEIQRHSRGDFVPPSIEGPTTDGPRRPMTRPTSAVMFSGGLDSLATVRENRRTHTPNDEAYFRYGVVLGSGFDEFEILPGTRFWESLATIADDAELELIPIQTNARTLQPTNHFFLTYLFGPLLASIGHFLAAGLTRVSINSAGVSDTETLMGSHPEVDPLFTSGAISVIHDLDTTTRLEKTRKISDWPVIKGRMRVCLFQPDYENNRLNCGRCEKCVRTMLSLLALGRLDDLALFEPVDITPEFIGKRVTLASTTWSFYPEIADALHDAGYPDLEAVVRDKLASWEGRKRGLVETLKRLDQQLLGGRLRRATRRLR